MAYYYDYLTNTQRSITQARGDIYTALKDKIGWDLYLSSDSGMAGSDIFSSKGEDGTKVRQYIELEYGTTGVYINDYFGMTQITTGAVEYYRDSDYKMFFGVRNVSTNAYNNYFLLGTEGSLEGKSSKIADTVNVTQTVYFNTSLNRVNWASYTQGVNVPVWFVTTGSLPSEISTKTIYYTVPTTSSVGFQISETLGGPAITFATTGTGTHTGYINYLTLTTDIGSGYFGYGDKFIAVKGSGRNTGIDLYLSMANSGTNAMYIYGNKDFVLLVDRKGDSSAETPSYTYDSMAFGHWNTFFPNVLCRTLEPLPNGASYKISVDNILNFKVGNTYQIAGEGIGREKITITAIDTDTNEITIDSTTVQNSGDPYPVGSLIGIQPCIFGAGKINISANFSYTCPFSFDTVVGNALGNYNDSAINIYLNDQNLFNNTALGPDLRTNLYFIHPFLGYPKKDSSAAANEAVPVYLPSFFMVFPSTTPALNDTLELDNLFTNEGVGATGGNDNEVEDSARSWDIDMYANKVLICLSNPTAGFPSTVGQIRKIISNTSTILTLDKTLGIGNFSGMTYRICAEGYRYFEGALTNQAKTWALREGY